MGCVIVPSGSRSGRPLGLPLGALSEVEPRRKQNQRQHHHQFKEGEARRVSLFSRIAWVIHGKLPCLRDSRRVSDRRDSALPCFIMLRDQIDYPEFCRRGSHVGMLGEVALA